MKRLVTGKTLDLWCQNRRKKKQNQVMLFRLESTIESANNTTQHNLVFLLQGFLFILLIWAFTFANEPFEFIRKKHRAD